MAATIKIKNSSTASAVPTSSDLVQGELAVNVTDKRIFTENASGTVVELGTNPSILTLPDGSASAPTLTNDGDTNTGIFFPAADTVGITTGGTERARVDSSGNMGLGVTPSASSASGVLFFNNGGQYTYSGPIAYQDVNVVYNSSADRYIANGYATRFSSVNGVQSWHVAPSGTAGNAITFTQAMTLDASGNLQLGTTTDYNPSGYSRRVNIRDSSNAALYIGNTGSSTNAMLLGWTSSDASVGTLGSVPLLFITNSTERARIDSSGNLLVGTTSTSVTNGGNVFITGTGGYAAMGHANGTGSGTYYYQFLYNGSGIGGITQNGTTAVAYNTSSDYRLKNSIAPMTGALAKVAALKPVTYKWNADNSDGEGFIAHELAEVCPHAVTGEKDAVDDDGNPKYQGIDTSFLVATLTAAIQEQQAIITALTARIEALEA